MRYKLRGDALHPEDLFSGRVLGPHEEVELSKEEASHPHNKRLIDEELLVPVDEKKEPQLLEGEELRKKGKRLNIDGYSKMSADDLRAAIAEVEKEGGDS